MRNALLILVGSGLLSVGFVEESTAADGPPSSIYAIPVVGQGAPAQEELPGLLPVRYSDQPQAPVFDQADRQSASPQASNVEAIPTPTAFHAGGMLLLAIFLTRWFRKLRWA